MAGPDPGPVDVVEVGAVPPYCRFKVLIRTSLPVRNLTVRRNARRCSRAWRVLPAARLVAADEDTVRDVIPRSTSGGWPLGGREPSPPDQ